jgi:hypothetical protein
MSATRRNVANFCPNRPILAAWFLLCRHTFVTHFSNTDGPKTANKKRALSNSHVMARQPKKRGPKEHNKQHLENASSRCRLPCPAASVAVPPPPPPLPSCCCRVCSCHHHLCRHAASIAVPLPSPCCHSHHCHHRAPPPPPPCHAVLLPPLPPLLCS